MTKNQNNWHQYESISIYQTETKQMKNQVELKPTEKAQA